MTEIILGIVARKNGEGQDEFLLTSSKRDFGEYTGFYYPPGGHKEEGEDEKTALVREFREELGIAIRVIEKIAVLPGDIEGLTIHWWKCEMEESEISIGINIKDAGFFTHEEMNKMNVWPATREFFLKYFITDK